MSCNKGDSPESNKDNHLHVSNRMSVMFVSCQTPCCVSEILVSGSRGGRGVPGGPLRSLPEVSMGSFEVLSGSSWGVGGVSGGASYRWTSGPPPHTVHLSICPSLSKLTFHFRTAGLSSLLLTLPNMKSAAPQSDGHASTELIGTRLRGSPPRCAGSPRRPRVAPETTGRPQTRCKNKSTH